MNRRVLGVLAVAALLALAGCSGSDGGTTAAPSPTPDDGTPTPGQSTTGNEASTPDGTPTPDGEQSGDTELSLNASASTLRDRAVAAMEGVDQYRLRGDQTAVVESNNVEQQTTATRRLAVDRTATAFERNLTSQAQGRTVTILSYLQNETLYTKSPINTRRFGAEWTKLDVSDNESEVLQGQDRLANYRGYLANATVSARPVETDDGVAPKLIADVPSGAFADVRGLPNGSTVSHADLNYTLDPETYRPSSIHFSANWTVDTGKATITQDVSESIDLTYTDVTVTLPPGTDDAVDITPENESDDESEDSGDASGDGDDETQSTNAADRPGIDVRGGSLAIDPDRTFHDLERTLETNVTDPAAVVVRKMDERDSNESANETDSLPSRQTFASTVGLERAAPETNVSVGTMSIPYRWVAEVVTSGLGNVYLKAPPGMSAPVQRVFATHEFVHYAQLQSGHWETVNSQTDRTTDGRFAFRATIEGAAVVATDATLDRVAPDGPDNAPLYTSTASALPPGSATAYRNAQYLAGLDYVQSRVDDPAALPSVYEDAPTTSEQVLHGGSEPPAPLTVSLQADNYTVADRDRKGEAYLRHVLASGVSFDRASAAAAGWGNDTLLTLSPTDGGNASYLWVQRFDDAANASEFVDAAQSYLQNYGTTTDGTTTLAGRPATLRTPDDRTAVLVVGPEALQSSLTVDTEGSTITATTD